MTATDASDRNAELGEKVRVDGFAIVPGAVERDLVAELRATLAARMDELELPFGGNVFLGRRTRRLFNLLARDPLFARVPVHPALLGVAEAVLDRELLLSSLTGIEMHPGETDQPFHADDGSLGIARPHPPFTCTAILALTDFSRQNGATRLVPGSHERDRRPRKGEVPEFFQAEMTAGSALVYHGSLWHAGGANTSAAPRSALVVNYCAGFLRQEEAQLLALPREQVAGFPRRLQELVGYGTYRGLLGHVDQRDPATLLDPTRATDMVWSRMR